MTGAIPDYEVPEEEQGPSSWPDYDGDGVLGHPNGSVSTIHQHSTPDYENLTDETDPRNWPDLDFTPEPGSPEEHAMIVEAWEQTFAKEALSSHCKR